MPKIVLLTSGQPSLNPRLIKEADALVTAGYEVTVLYQYWNGWATTLDEELLGLKTWKTVRVGGHPKNFKSTYLKSRILHRIFNSLAKNIGFKYQIAERSIGRCTLELGLQASLIPADLYIAHNLAALPAAVKAAGKNNSKSGFDAEDFHRYEMSDDSADHYVKLKSFIEEKYFPEVDYLTASSPQIAEKYKELFPKLVFNTILNVFPKQENLKSRTLNGGTLKLIWFSQNIGLSRGLQDVLFALRSLQEFNIEFHILGYLASNVKHELDELFSTLNFPSAFKINFHEPIDPISLQKFISQFDIGLATEPAFSINNDCALSNKIFTYIQCGLAVIASDTTAQKQLLEEYSNMGLVYDKNNSESLSKVIKAYAEDRNLLFRHQQQAKKYANDTLNWEIESKKFIAIVEKTLSD